MQCSIYKLQKYFYQVLCPKKKRHLRGITGEWVQVSKSLLTRRDENNLRDLKTFNIVLYLRRGAIYTLLPIVSFFMSF